MHTFQTLPAVGFPDTAERQLPLMAFIVVPVHNQAGELHGLVANIFQRSCPYCYVVIVDDKSSDGTLLVAYALCKLYAPRLHIARQSTN